MSDQGISASAPDGGWGWMVVIASFMIHVIADGVTYSFGVLAIEFLEHFEANREEIGWIGSIMVGITLGAGPISGTLCNRFSYRSVTIVGSIIASIGFALTYFATATWVIFITIGLITGAGFGLVYLPAIVTVGLYFEKKRSFAMGLAVCGSGVGTLIFAPITEKLIEEYSWQGAVLIISALILNCAVCGALLRPLKIVPFDEKSGQTQENEKLLDRKQMSQSPSSRDKTIEMYVRSLQEITPPSDDRIAVSFMNTAPSHVSHPHLYIASIASLHSIHNLDSSNSNVKSRRKWKERMSELIDLRLMKNPIFVLFILSNFFTSIGFNAPFMYVPDRGVQEGLSVYQSTMLLSVIGFANTIGRILFGIIANLRGVDRLQLYNVSLFLCGLATILSFLCKTYPLMIGYSALFGLLIGVYVTLTSVVLVDLLGVEQLNSSFGLTICFQGLAVLIGPPLAGWIFDRTQSYDPSFWVCGAMIGISGVMLFPLPCIRTCLIKRNYVV